MLHHDGAPAHTVNLVQQFLTKHGTIQVLHPLYSPDMSPPDFFLFPKIKNILKGSRFRNIEFIKQNSTQQLQAIPSLSSRNVSRAGNIVGPMEHISKEIDSKTCLCMYVFTQ
ncbi:HTH_48 domain-containing protein [Trichonephila clavipes]|nr:HTH_48 domain-containing protein [Trichonephila clavipes]